MKLRVIGRYGPFAVDGKCSCYVLSAGNTNIVIDMGAGSLSELQKYIQLDNIDAVILSHLHFDHMSDALTMKYAAEQYAKFGKSIKAKLYMPESPKKHFELLSDWPCEVCVITENSVKIGEIDVDFCLMTHPAESYAIKAKHDDCTFVYSGDTSLNDRIAEFAKNCDLFLCDAGLVQKGIPHMTVKEAVNTAKEAKAKRTLLTHVCPFTEKEQLGFPISDKNIEWAQEGMEYNIGRD